MEAAYYADIIPPVCSGFEMETVYMRRDAIRVAEAGGCPCRRSKPDWEIWIDLPPIAKLDKKKSTYWTENFPLEWKDYRNLGFVKNTPAWVA